MLRHMLAERTEASIQGDYYSNFLRDMEVGSMEKEWNTLLVLLEGIQRHSAK